MRHVGKLWVVLLVFAMPLQAAVTATADRSVMTLADSLVLTLKATEGEDVDNVDLSELRRDFEVSSSGTSSRLSIVNGRSERSTERALVLLPKRSGSLKIPSLQVDGVRTRAQTIEVLPAPRNIDASQDVFVEAEVDQESVYLQSQLIHTFRIYQAVELTDRGRSKLEIPDAVVEELESVVFQRVVDGRPYRVIEVKHAIFPQKSGELTIPALSFNGRREMARGSLFSFGSGEMLRRRSNPITVEVKPIPASWPDATWLPAASLELEESWSAEPGALKVGDSVTRSFTVTAEGIDASLLPPLEQVEVPGLRVYPDQPKTENRPGRNGITGVATSSAALLITEPGQYTLPAVRLPWWDTNANRLRYARLPERTITVSGAAPATANEASPALPTVSQPAPTAITTAPTPEPLLANPWLWSTVAALLGWLLTVLWLLYARGDSGRQPAQRKQSEDTTQLYRALLASCKADRAREARLNLQRWAQQQLGMERSPTLSEVADAYNDPGLSDALAALDTCLYSPDAENRWQGKALLEALKKLRPGKVKASRRGSELPPLYGSGT
ncbi:MAG: BatD family protein [Halieaceae bacterium]|nr:BatD family protein [Halieaceae bacterium]